MSHFLQQLRVRIATPGVGNWAIVNKGSLRTPALLYVQVERVIARVDLAVGKPTVKGRGRIIQQDGRRPVPEHVLCRVLPHAPTINHVKRGCNFTGMAVKPCTKDEAVRVASPTTSTRSYRFSISSQRIRNCNSASLLPIQR